MTKSPGADNKGDGQKPHKSGKRKQGSQQTRDDGVDQQKPKKGKKQQQQQQDR